MPSVDAVVTMMKNATTLEKIMPVLTSACMFRTAPASVPLRDAMLVLPASFSSSTMSEDCQKKRYGVIVVPKTPVMVDSHVPSNRRCGMKKARATSPHGGRTTNAVTTYAKSDSVSHLNVLAIVRYERKACAAMSATPKKKTHASTGTGTTILAASAIPPISAPTLNVFATITTPARA